MAPLDRDSLTALLRSHRIDNFAIDGDMVRVGAAQFRAQPCRCGEAGCDGWALTLSSEAVSNRTLSTVAGRA